MEDSLYLNRIAIEELEAWYFGDWRAVTDSVSACANEYPSPRRIS